MTKKTVLILTGPTASGKSDIALKTAQAISGTILCMDSMQIYRHMDIGTAKPTPEEQNLVPHRMLDIVSPFDEYSAAQYKKDCAAFLKTEDHPILVGGTGLYLNAITTCMEFASQKSDPEVRKKYEQIAQLQGNEALHRMLQQKDALSAERLHPNDTRRIVRALEVIQITGIPFSAQKSLNIPDDSYHFVIFSLQTDRALLYDRINKRVDRMIEMGLIEEVEKLLLMGITGEEQSMQGIGYKELIPVLRDGASKEQAIDLIKQKSRNYAKRQLTWFRRDERIQWIDMDQNSVDSAKEILLKVYENA